MHQKQIKGQVALQHILDQHPFLHHSGIGVQDMWGRRPTPRERQQWLLAQRDLLQKDYDVFIRLGPFLATITPCKTIRRYMTSYGLKHIAEDWLQIYVANGTFIAAAIHAGFTWMRCDADSPNAYFNMTKSDIRRLYREASLRS